MSFLPSITEKLEYNDNIFLSSSRPVEDFINTISGGLQLLQRTERSELDLSARIDQLLYLHNSGLNSADQFYKGAFGYSLSPRFSLSTNGSYIRDSRRDQLFYTTGIVLNTTRREHADYSLSSSCSISEKTMASLSYDHSHDNFSDGTSPDFSVNSGTIAVLHDFSGLIRSTKVKFAVGYAQYDSRGFEVDNWQGLLGLAYDLHEKWALSIDGGARYTTSSFDAPTIVFVGPFYFYKMVHKTTADWGYVGHLTLSYKGEVTNADLTVVRDLNPAYGSSGAVQTTGASFTIGRRLSYDLTGRIGGGYFQNRANAGETAATSRNTRSWYVNPSLRYDFNRDTYLEGSYNFTRYENRDANTTATGNSFVVRFFLQHRFLE